MQNPGLSQEWDVAAKGTAIITTFAWGSGGQEAFLNKQVRSGNKIEFGQLTKLGNTLEPAMGGQPRHMPLYPTLAGSSPPAEEEFTLKSPFDQRRCHDCSRAAKHLAQR